VTNPRPTLVFLGRHSADIAVFKRVVQSTGAVAITEPARALEMMKERTLTAMVIGADLDDAAALRIIGLARRLQPMLTVVVVRDKVRAPQYRVKADATKIVDRVSLANSVREVIADSAINFAIEGATNRPPARHAIAC